MSATINDLGFLTEGETAELYGVIVATLRNWRARRVGPAYYKRAGGVVYHIDDIRAHLASRRVETAA